MMDMIAEPQRLLAGRRAVIVAADGGLLQWLREVVANAGLDGHFAPSLAALEGLLTYRPPEFLFLSCNVAGSNWLDVLRSLRRRLPRTVIVLLTDLNPDSTVVVNALRNGAANVAHCGQTVEHMVAELTWEVVEGALAEDGRPGLASAEDQLALLTRRERDVLLRLLRGKSNKQVAAELAISHRTVEAHRARCMRKLGARNSVDLARRFAGTANLGQSD